MPGILYAEQRQRDWFAFQLTFANHANSDLVYWYYNNSAIISNITRYSRPDFNSLTMETLCLE